MAGLRVLDCQNIRVFPFSVILLALLVAPVASAAPIYSSRVLVLSQGSAGDWDQAGVSQPMVISSGSMWHMWYTGTDGNSSGIGYAISSDGRHWTRVQNKAVTISGAGWSGPAMHPTVIANAPGDYRMWFSGDIVGGSIGQATSNDRTNWIGASAVLMPGSPGSWDEGGVGAPTVVRDSSGYWMWFIGVDSTGGNASIGLATSPDGVTWAKSFSNPVLSPKAGEWYSAGLSGPGAVILKDGRFVLWFAGDDGNTTRIGRVISMDGVSWSAPELVLDLGEPSTADGSKLGDPSPTVEDMDTVWYSGSDNLTWRILLAVPKAADPPPPIVTGTTAAVAFTVGVGSVGAAVVASSDRFKYAFFAIPLSFRWVKDKNLDPFVRGQIFQYIRANPGDYYSSIMMATGATNGNLIYHLHVLEREGFITVVKDGKFVRFYPKGIPVPTKDGVRFSALQVRIMERITQEPGITQTDLAKAVGVRKQTISYNIYSLAECGAIEVRKIGRVSYLYIVKKDVGQKISE